MRYKLCNTCYKLCNTCYKLCNKKLLGEIENYLIRKAKLPYMTGKIFSAERDDNLRDNVAPIYEIER
mgnify:CR=1 FL=1